jgi:hypothetical protein
MTPPKCGAQKPGEQPNPFEWWLFAAVAAAGAAAVYVHGNGIPIINGIIQGITKSAPVIPATMPLLTGSFAGAAAILVLVLYFFLKADGCIINPKNPKPVCLSGIVQDTADTSSAAIAVLAPFAIPPAGLFNVVVKSNYFYLVAQDAHWVYCSPAPPETGSPMLPCIVKSESACGGKVGALAGAAAGAVAGTVAGFLGGAATHAALAAAGCAVSGPFYLLCMLIARPDCRRHHRRGRHLWRCDGRRLDRTGYWLRGQ